MHDEMFDLRGRPARVPQARDACDAACPIVAEDKRMESVYMMAPPWGRSVAFATQRELNSGAV